LLNRLGNSQTLLEDYRFQTPGNSGVWEDLEGTYNLDEADIVVIRRLYKRERQVG
jgi:hypothetical protein